MYQYRNNMLKPNKPIYKKNVINFIHNPFTSRMKLIRASAFGKKS